MKRPQSKTFLYGRMPHDGKRLVCLQQNIVGLAWLLFLKQDPLSPVVRPHSKNSWFNVSGRSIRNHLGFMKRNLRFLLAFREYQRQGGKSDGLVALPCYGQVCLPVHRGYKVFDWYRKAVIKVFDPEVDKSRILEEINLLQQASQFDFAPSIRKWNVEERWYEEEYLNGSPDASSAPMDAETLLSRFQGHLVHALRAVMLSQEPKVTKAVTYVTGLMDIHNVRRLSRQESTVQELTKAAEFMDAIVGQLRREGDHAIFLVFTHGDFVPANMVNTKQGMKIIDWEGAGYRSAFYDFYSYFFHRSGSRDIPVSMLMSNVQKALPLFMAELAGNVREVAWSANRWGNVYRRIFYIEMLCRLIERERTDNNLHILRYISRYLEVFIRYEEGLARQDV